MEHDRIKPYESIYFRCRKQAALYNDKLNSREGAAELLGCSVSSVAGYELGTTKCVPADVVVLMADLYNAPELLNYYCKALRTPETSSTTTPSTRIQLLLQTIRECTSSPSLFGEKPEESSPLPSKPLLHGAYSTG